MDNRKKVVLAIIVIILVVLASALTYFWINNKNTETDTNENNTSYPTSYNPNQAPVSMPQSKPQTNADGWTLHENKYLGLSLYYPTDLLSVESDEYYSIFRLKNPDKYSIDTAVTFSKDKISDLQNTVLDTTKFKDISVNNKQPKVERIDIQTYRGQSSGQPCAAEVSLQAYYIREISNFDITIPLNSYKFDCESEMYINLDSNQFNQVKKMLTTISLNNSLDYAYDSNAKSYISSVNKFNILYPGYLSDANNSEPTIFPCNSTSLKPEVIEIDDLVIEVNSQCGRGGGGYGVAQMDQYKLKSKSNITFDVSIMYNIMEPYKKTIFALSEDSSILMYQDNAIGMPNTKQSSIELKYNFKTIIENWN